MKNAALLLVMLLPAVPALALTDVAPEPTSAVARSEPPAGHDRQITPVAHRAETVVLSGCWTGDPADHAVQDTTAAAPGGPVRWQVGLAVLAGGLAGWLLTRLGRPR